jgi:ABC-type transporter Mla MlaB component
MHRFYLTLAALVEAPLESSQKSAWCSAPYPATTATKVLCLSRDQGTADGSKGRYLMPIRIETKSPTFIVQRIEGDLHAHEMQNLTQAMEKIMAAGQRIGVIIDTARIGKVDTEVLKLGAQWLKQGGKQMGQLWIGYGMVIPAASTRFLLSSLLLITRMPMPYKVFDTYEQAARWLVTRFREEKLPIPDALKLYS